MNVSTPTWDELFARLPPEFGPYALRLAWDHRRLWELDLPIEEMATSDLEWQLDLRWWHDGDRFFALRPRDVLADPLAYPEHHERALAADLRFPLDLTLRSGRWFILDGVHRLLKAEMLGEPSVRVRRIPASALENITTPA